MRAYNRAAEIIYALLFGFTLSSTLVRHDHPEIGHIQYPLAVCVLTGVCLVIRVLITEAVNDQKEEREE